MTLNIRKSVAQRATKFHKSKENVNFYIVSIEIDVCVLVKDTYISETHVSIFKLTMNAISF